ncbi:ricin-type beta-trefoil lectin domain protein [Streptomyces sp. HMX112]|uniref:RICIN domain-containing protein n=1 Tax=Streptomyces sp. HMX112 TaxID=3390850 RepID=UPI003A802853
MKGLSGPDFPSGGAVPAASERIPRITGEPSDLPVEELLRHHWRAVLDYASLCTVSPLAARKLAGAAFLRRFGDPVQGSGAGHPWRPRLLATVGRIADEWSRDERGFTLRPALRPAPDLRRGTVRGAGRRDRELLLRAFEWLPARAQVLLWHAEVEADDIAVAAGLAGLPADAAEAELRADRGRLRAACRQMHLDLAVDDACRGYSGLIEAATRRPGAPVLPDLRRHLDACAHCRSAAEQLDHSPGRLPLLLAEAVLGYGAASYVASRRAGGARRGRRDAAPVRSAAAERPPGATDGPGGRVPPVPAGRRLLGRRRSPLVLGIVVMGLLGAALLHAVSTGPDDRRAATPAVPTAPPPPAAPPSAVSPSAPAPSPSATSAPGRPAPPDRPAGDLVRFRNAATGRCLAVRGPAAVGAPALTAPCTAAGTQRWRFDTRGALHSEAADELCLAAHPASFRVRLARCAGRPGQAAAPAHRLSAGGLLTPRLQSHLAVTPADPGPGAVLVLKVVDSLAPDPAQRWRAESAPPPVRHAR